MSDWLTPLDVDHVARARVYPKLAPEQRKFFFGHIKGSSSWIFRFLDFTEPEGEEELLAQIARDGFVEAGTYTCSHYAFPNEEWGAVGDPNAREEDRRQPSSRRHLDDIDPDWLQKEKAAKKFWKEAAETLPERKQKKLGRCINCAQAAFAYWNGYNYCDDCLPEEAELDETNVWMDRRANGGSPAK